MMLLLMTKFKLSFGNFNCTSDQQMLFSRCIGPIVFACVREQHQCDGGGVGLGLVRFPNQYFWYQVSWRT